MKLPWWWERERESSGAAARAGEYIVDLQVLQQPGSVNSEGKIIGSAEVATWYWTHEGFS
jgi:hypothetical protein